VPTQPDDLNDVLTDFVMRLMKLTESDGMDAMIDLDLSFSQARMLFLLAKTGEPMAIHSIAEGIGLSDAAAGRNVEQLLKIDVVERRESPDDRRVKLVTLTPSGEKLAASHLDAKRDALRSFSAALPADQRDNLHAVLSDILASGALRSRKNQENCL
jgi:DNA-binding MarR family transcriptional regulator